ncbi:TspO/MBR family protein [Tichowtungia aerotolerans]|uniref:Tryptophan-rich sensory protein n=1 Tax=Tichowtungia aerotolerans TaxID=2697043 RepID=A0A6P1M9F9_9BACT|nr:TspO/MBR family protein [Tichowtungia aerotolerans]QHI69194.1 tryptophan-rich sensory protein [Tichowtungia aerotolerans]
MKTMKNIRLLMLFQIIAFLPSLGALSVDTGGWYASLYKPPWGPPSWVFAPVWIVLYVLIGLSGYLGWTRGGRVDRTVNFVVYGTQLVLNGLWPLLFFGLHRISWALGALVMMWFLILICISAFSQRSGLAAWLMLPYFLWVSFAGALNSAILVIN